MNVATGVEWGGGGGAGVTTAVNPGGICAQCLECKHSRMTSRPARITSYQLSTQAFSCEQAEKSAGCVYSVVAAAVWTVNRM